MYYRLTYKTATNQRKVGDSVLSARRPVDIGQTPLCDAPLPESDQYESLLCATILPDEEGRGWYIVRRTDYLEIDVNGRGLEAAVPLHDGDILSFYCTQGKVDFRFNICRDSDYDESTGVVYRTSRNRWRIVGLFGLLIFVVALAVIFVIRNTHSSASLRYADFDQYNTSIYHISVDSVYLGMDTLIGGEMKMVRLLALPLENPCDATCFLTDDGYFVTARHCVEPWINNESWDGISKEMPVEVRLAVEAETRNNIGAGNHYTVWAHCVVSRNVEYYEYKSTDFCMNYSRDMVLPLGTQQRPLYLRSIIPLANRRDMELGDFAYIKAPGINGKLSLASSRELLVFNVQTDRDVAVLGFPVNDNNSEDVVNNVFGNSQHFEYDADSCLKGCIQMSAPINPGNSGGPVLARIGGKIKVVGIVSKADMKASQGTFWAVPISEVTTMMAQGDRLLKIRNDIRRY